MKNIGVVWYEILSNNFQFLNNITRIFILFYLHVFSKNINITRTTLLNEPIAIVKFDREICFKNEKDMFTTFSQQFIGD